VSEQREWKFYIQDMTGFIHKARSYTDNLDQCGFEQNDLVWDATIRNIELIGEAATHIPDNIRKSHSEIPWRMIIATRNRLIHGYLGIDNDTVR
jgi:uncharacterized protein with HEPN domain